MSYFLTDQDLSDMLTASLLSCDGKQQLAIQELQRWRAASAWLFQICGRVCAYDVGSGPKAWFARENSFTEHILSGAFRKLPFKLCGYPAYERSISMKCDAIGCASEQDRQCRGLCFVCFTKRRFAGEEEEAKWDHEHRKPKELVIEVEVPAEWFRSLFPDKGIDVSTKEASSCKWLMFIHPPGRLVLKARKETP